MAIFVCPTENVIGELSGKPTDILSEYALIHMARGQRGQGRKNKISGLTISAGTGRAVDISAGFGFIDGYIVGIDAATTESNLTASRTRDDPNYIYMQLEYTGSVVTNLLIEKTTDSNLPAHSLLLGTASTDTDTVTGVQNSVVDAGNCVYDTYAGDNTDNRFVLIGHTPHLVILNYVVSTSRYFRVSPLLSSLYGFYIQKIDTAAAEIFMSTDDNDIPEIRDFGFEVSSGINTTGVTYHYLAFLD